MYPDKDPRMAPSRLYAAYRLLAAKADEERAFLILLNLGFKGLTLVSNGGGIIRYKYKSYDEPRLNHLMGDPKADIKAPNIRYPYGVHGLLAVWPGKSEVLLRNTKSGKESIELPEALKDVPNIPHATVQPPAQPPSSIPQKTGTENDDSHVPITHISEALHQQYLRCQASPKYRVKFMQDIWIYLNQSKFGGHLRQPNLVLMKGSAAARMRTRGYWEPSTWSLKIHPQIFNASQNFFVEIFLHEMCHEAVSQHWHELSVEERKDDRKHQGHGTAWSAWMRHVGLNPLRFDPNESRTYMAEQEKAEHDALDAQWQESKDAAESLGLKLVTSLKIGDPVIVRRMDGLRRGYLVCQVKKAHNEWAVLPIDTAENYKPPQALTWHLNYAATIYVDPDGKSKALDMTFLEAATRIIQHYQRKKDAAAAKREYNKMRRFDDY